MYLKSGLKMKKTKRITLLFIILYCIPIACCTGCTILGHKVTTYYGNDTSNYLKYDRPLYDGGTPYIVDGFFPEELNSTLEVIDYYYRAEFPNDFRGTYWELVLHVKYNDENYSQEVQRLNDYIVDEAKLLSESGHYKEISLDAINSNLFNYETIIKEYYVCDGTFRDTSCLYIYAILDRDNNEIVYVYLKSPIGNKHNPYLDSKYLPINYFKNEKNKSADYLDFDDYHYSYKS